MREPDPVKRPVSPISGIRDLIDGTDDVRGEISPTRQEPARGVSRPPRAPSEGVHSRAGTRIRPVCLTGFRAPVF